MHSSTSARSESSDVMLPATVGYTRNNSPGDNAFRTRETSGADEPGDTPLEEILPVHNRSVLLTSTRPYESVVTTLKEGFPMVRDPSSTVQNNSLAQIPVDEKEKGTAEKLKSYFEGGSAIPQDTVNDPINNYTLFISPERQRDNSPFNEGEDGCEKSQSISSKSRLPYGGDSGICSKSFGAAGVMQNNWKKIASPLPSATNSRQMSTSPTTFPSPPRENDALLGKDASNAADDFIYMTDHLVPHWAPCYSRNNLEDDSVSLMAFWQSLKSETVSKSILYSFRTTLFAVVPTYILTAHPSTAHWFVGKALVPVIAALFVKPNLGFQIIMIVLTIQVCLAVMTWGIIMNAVGAVHNTSGWWCGVVFAPFIVSLFGDVPSKRLIMMYVIIIMQLEHSPGGETFIFPVKFARDVAIASAFALIANVLPYPVFAQKQAKEAMAGLHKLYAAAIGNAMKSYWAPVNIDARAARGQIPFERMREVTGIVRTLIHFISYEPTEFDLTNILRQERLAALGRIKSHLHAMTAVASQRIAAGQNFSTPQYVKEFEKRMQHPCMELAKAIIDVLPVLGTHLKPADVAAKVPYVEIANKTIMLQDVIEREQLQMLFITRAIGEETISYLRTFSFAHSLLNIAAEIQQIETAMKNFDPSKYPSMWSRAFDFFFYDNWKDFWTELPKRLTLATPRDVRIVKDSIKYALAFAVACAFTLHYDEENVYYFGMAILIRLAQQTASETLIIGVYRICGLCIGCALSYITATKTHTFTQTTLLTMTFSFISLCFGLHPVYSFGAQYVFVVSITGIALAHQPSLLLTRTTDNVFAFISFFVICAFLFPFDPIRVLWNVRTKILMNINDATQTFVALGCAPITKDGDEGQFFMPQLKQIIGQQQLLLKEYGEWMVKCVTEPTIRGGEYPSPQDSILYHALWELCSLQEAMLSAMARLHRPRTAAPSIIVRDVMELTHPFLQDAGRLVQSYCQSLINATETPLEWSLEEAIHILWKGELACRSLNRITANIQKNFFAAVHQLSTCEKKKVNVYLPADVIEEAFRAENDASLNPPAEDDELMQRLYAMSFHMSSNTVFPSEDMHAFNSIVNMFELMLHTMAELLPPMVKIHAFEKSRVI